jgi:hypothetical protein
MPTPHPKEETEVTDQLVQCPRCRYYTRSPDDHFYPGGPAEGDRSNQAMRYCTTSGVVVRQLPPAPPLEPGWGWSVDPADGQLKYRRVEG